MPSVTIDGIVTYYEVIGSGPPLLMFSPGGFDAKIENWTSFSIYQRLRLLPHLAKTFTCITFDRRESGRSGGRVEQVGWGDYVNQAKGLLDHLHIEQAHLMGGCVGCSVALAFGVAYPDSTLRMVLYSPAGGPRYRMAQQSRFDEHLAFVAHQGLGAVVELAINGEQSFSQDPRVGIWSSVIRRDPSFAKSYRDGDPQGYGLMVKVMAMGLFDRDTVPGAEPEELMALPNPSLIVPGQDASHAPSAARYLEECLSHCEYWDVPVIEQTEDNAPERVLQFLRT